MVDIALINRNRFGVLDLVEAAARRLELWRRRARGRRALARLSERELRDLALSRSDARLEIAKPFWRA